jgi:gliding motility-associated-like protein
MKKLITFLCWMACSVCFSQQFTVKTEIELPDSLLSPKLLWVDVDNSGLLDLVVAAEDSQGRNFFLTYKNDTTSGFEFKSVQESDLTNAVYLFSDTDLDNDMDIIVSGLNGAQAQTITLINEGHFNFSKEIVATIQAKSIAFGDLSSDGFPEMILSGVKNSIPFFSILRKETGNWTLVSDSLKVNASSIVIHDFDKDSKNDFAISGTRSDNVIVSQVYFNQGNYFFKPAPSASGINGRLSIADFNADGYPDLFVHGKNSSSVSSNDVLFNNGHTFKVKTDSLPILENATYFFADFNSNGKQDTYQFGTNSSGQPQHYVLNDARTSTSINILNAIEVAAGDYEHDGDLDIAVLTKTPTELKIVILANKVPVNHGPGKPFNVISARVFNRIFLWWEKPSDDHTLSQLISYDVSLQGNGKEIMSGEFDLFNLKRLTVSSGNVGTRNYLVLTSNDAASNYTIQAIDNSFHTGSGICRGGVTCSEYQTVNVEACKNEIITFRDPGAMWFSFSNGLLSTATDEYVYDFRSKDTLFSVTPGIEGKCALIKLYNVIIKEKLVRKTEDTKYICAGALNLFSVEEGWAQVDWSSSLKGFLSHENSVQFKTNLQDTLKVKLLNGEGCALQRNTILKLSTPPVAVESETYQILRGEQVRLKASGAATYSWSPSEALSDPNVFDPIASPLHSIQYIVTGADSIGCIGNAAVRIIVEGTAFIPNLFTPNDDGQNDDVKIYGLADVKNFTFTIHNREGNIVFETHDLQHATSIGWDGTARGSKQPNGVYYWKVRGQQQSGKSIQLNGKTQGSIVLIR